MTPKQKAAQLFNKYCYAIRVEEDNSGYFVNIFYSKQCALIAVEEILENFGTLTEGKQHYAAYCTIKFYEQVKQEIEKL